MSPVLHVQRISYGAITPADTSIKKNTVVIGEKMMYKMLRGPLRPPGGGIME